MRVPFKTILVICCLVTILSVADADCVTGTVNLNLVSTSGSGCDANPFAKCFSSMTLSVTANCVGSIAPSGSNNYIPALWTSTNPYKVLRACPPVGSASLSSTVDDLTLMADFENIFAGALWSTPLTTNAPTLAASSGVLTMTHGSCTLKYRSQDVTGFAFSSIGVEPSSSCSAGECSSSASGCTAGRYATKIKGQQGYLCGLCGAGTYSSAGADTCTPCDAGQELSTVGGAGNVCSNCPAGYTAGQDGTSDCQPCPTNTFQDQQGQLFCNTCASGFYAHVPGSTTCVKCITGRPVTCSESNGAGCSATAASSGYATAQVTSSDLESSAGWSAANFGVYPPIANVCALEALTTSLLFEVSGTCEIRILSMNDGTNTPNGLSCSDPTNDDSHIHDIFYTSATTIQSRLPSFENGGALWTISQASGVTLTVTMQSVTRDPNVMLTGAQSRSGTLKVTGSKISGNGANTCPAGTSENGSDDSISCAPCPTGSYCASSTSVTACSAGTANDLYGATASSACVSCPVNTYSGSDNSPYCIPCYGADAGSVTCDGNEGQLCPGDQFWDPTANNGDGACACAQGYGGTAGSCLLCEPGTFSPGDSASCSICPPGTWADAGSAECQDCPAGTRPDIDGSRCIACLKGQEFITASNQCEACQDGYYNPESDEEVGKAAFPTCMRCGSGFKTDNDKTQCTACAKGTVSIWDDNGQRSPEDYSTCSDCPKGTYQDSLGQSRCIACPGGTFVDIVAATDVSACSPCTAGFYRPPFAPSTTGCLACPEGTNSAAGATSCGDCAPGEFLNSSGECEPCPPNYYTNEPGATICKPCPAGTDTLGEEGHDSCTPCGKGKFGSTAGAACGKCTAGKYSSATGSRSCKACSVGTASLTTGRTTSCARCPAGKYAPRPGSTVCRTCPAGSISAAGKGNCQLCPRGRFSTSGSARCELCAAGTFTNRTGTATCSRCTPGHQCPIRGMSSPQRCPRGSYASTRGRKACILCPPDSYAATTGSTTCTPCSGDKTTDDGRGATTAAACIDVSNRRLLGAAPDSSLFLDPAVLESTIFDLVQSIV